jgi:hypothetical protein
MARIKNGIPGGLSGKIGMVVGSTWRGIDYIRSLPIYNGKATKNQLIQRAKFSLATSFVKAMKDLLMLTYIEYDSEMTVINNAIRHVMKGAITGVYPGFRIEFSKAVIAKGALPMPEVFPVAASSHGEIIFRWVNDSGLGSAKPKDRVVLVAYCEEMNLCIHKAGPDTRGDERGILSMPLLAGKQVHTWLSFLTINGKDGSPSCFTGTIVVPDQ